VNLFAAYSARFPEPGKVLLTTPNGTSYTYADAERYSAQVANCLLGMGLHPGDRVTVQVEKSAEVLWLFLGCLRAGLIYHPLNTAYTDEELRYFLDDAGTALLVCDGRRSGPLRQLCDGIGVRHTETLDADGSGSLPGKWATAGAEFTTAKNTENDVAALVYSSGTTGKPKGIMLSHGNLISNASVLVDYWGFTGDDCLLHALPVFHVHGLFVALGCVFMSGGSMRWLPRFDAQVVLRELPQSTAMMGVPTYYTRLLSESSFNEEACAGMRLFISGSAPLLAETHREFQQRTGHAILERYGMTETGMNTSNPLDGERRAGTVGLPLPGTDVRVCGVGDVELPVGQVGELQVKGGNVFVGYWNMPDKTAEDFTADGFFRTGDQAQIDERGYVAIVGRAKDMVISGGLNIYPKEVELVIDDFAGVAESAVIGLPDTDFGEIVAAVVVGDGTRSLSEEAVRDFARGQLAGFKVPKRVFFVDELPRNTMGKVQKAALREEYAGSGPGH